MALLLVIGCVVASFFFMTFLVVIFDSLLAKFNVSCNIFWHIFNALLSGAFAFSAGYFAAWLPLYLGGNIEDSLQSVVGLAMLTAAMSFVCFCGSIFAKSSGEPMWFHLVLFIVSNIGIMQGGSQLVPSSLIEQQQYFILNFLSHFRR